MKTLEGMKLPPESDDDGHLAIMTSHEIAAELVSTTGATPLTLTLQDLFLASGIDNGPTMLSSLRRTFHANENTGARNYCHFSVAYPARDGKVGNTDPWPTWTTVASPR